jgi:hypothetical protein
MRSDGKNCQCSKCGELDVHSYTRKISGRKFEDTDNFIQHDKWNRPLKCSKKKGCDGILTTIPFDPEDNDGFASIGKYSACNKEERNRKMKQRAQKHTRKVLGGGRKQEIEKKHVEPIAKEMGGKYKEK